LIRFLILLVWCPIKKRATLIDSTTGNEVPVQLMLPIQPLLSNGIKGMTAADYHLQHIYTLLLL
jgi:hypothetical protein